MSNYEILTGEVIDSEANTNVQAEGKRIRVRNITSLWLSLGDGCEERFDVSADLPVRPGHLIVLIISRNKRGTPHVWFAANRNTRQEYLHPLVVSQKSTFAVLLGGPFFSIAFANYTDIMPHLGLIGVFFVCLGAELFSQHKLKQLSHHAKVSAGFFARKPQAI